MEKSDVEDYLKKGSEIRNSLDTEKIFQLGKALSSCFKNGNKLIVMGNGGSAADAQHIAAEFVGRFERERKSLPALALHSNTSSITAIGNDYSFDDIYARQIEAFANQGDLVLGLSTSGNSKNILRGLQSALKKNCLIYGITGTEGGKMKDIVEEPHLILINSTRTSFIQECTIAVGHIISKIVEDDLE